MKLVLFHMHAGIGKAFLHVKLYEIFVRQLMR